MRMLRREPMWLRWLRWCFCIAAVGLAGCRLTGFALSAHEDPPPPQYVVVEEGHICGPYCHDHYWDGARVVVVRGHRHGPGCGHEWDGHYWVAVGKARVTHVHEAPRKVVKMTHVHDVHCGCVYHPYQRTWVVVEPQHVHGPGCGHVYVEGRWTIRY
jgi:hypothetical protein